jgi:DeoR/GlpR family transcriptional regulator of sugar metabolism
VQLANALIKRITEGNLKNISIVTNSLMNLQQLAPYINVVLTGGEYSQDRKSLSGALSETFISQFRFSKSFLGADSMTFKNGFMTAVISYSRLSRLAASLATQSFVLMDSSKIDIPSFVVHSRLDQVSALITDDNILPEHLATFQKHGLPVHMAPVKDPLYSP